jgi:hypothetical protein
MVLSLITAAALTAAISGPGSDVRLADSMQQRGGGNSGDTITVRACNHIDEPTMVAVSYIPVGGSSWRNKGWFTVAPGDCTDVLTTTNRTIYLRAEVKDDPSRYWGSDIKQCVEYPGPYDFYTGSEETTCPEGEPQEFTTIRSDGSPVFVWNLNP